MAEGYELVFLIGGLFLSLCAFSLLFGDNYLFRLGASVLSGAVSAYICVLLVESYFYPLILDLINNRAHLTSLQIVRVAVVTISVLFLFLKSYSGNKTGGKIIMTVLMSVCAVLLVIGAAGGTIPAFIRSLAGQFRIAALPAEDRADIWYWIRAATVLISAITALLFARHYSLSGKKPDENHSESLAGSILTGFSFGAIAAAVFITAANIFVNHISGIIDTIQSLGR